MKASLKEELIDLQAEEGLAERIPCTKEDSAVFLSLLKNGEPLPTGVSYYKTKYEGKETYHFYTLSTPELNEKERLELIYLRQLQTVKTIKKCVVFFTVLTVLSLVASVLAVLGAF